MDGWIWKYSYPTPCVWVEWDYDIKIFVGIALEFLSHIMFGNED